MGRLKMIIVTMVLILTTFGLMKTEVIYSQNQSNMKAFCISDTAILNIRLNMDKGEVEKKLGKPLKIKQHYEGAFDANVIDYYYKFGSIEFEPLDEEKYTLSTITINKPNYNGPRGIQINDNINEVIKKFPNNQGNSFDTEGNRILYKDEGQNCGLLTYNGDKTISAIIYKYGEYTLLLEVKNNKVVLITLNIMTV